MIFIQLLKKFSVGINGHKEQIKQAKELKEQNDRKVKKSVKKIEAKESKSTSNIKKATLKKKPLTSKKK